MAHTWSMDSAATAASIANHFVHQLEICLCKSCENWDVILALGGVLRSHPQAMTILETLLKQLRDNYTLLPDSQKRLYRQAYEMVLLQLLPLSQHQQHLLQWRSLEARLLLFYLLDCFRFAQPFVNQRSPAVGAAGTAQGLAEAGASRMRMQCGDMMLTMGQSIVALTVWNLHQSTKAFEYDKTRAAQPPDAAGRGGSQYRHFVLDIEQLTWTKDLLKYYQTRLQERLGGPNAPGAPTAAPAGAGAGADSNGVHVGAPPPPTSTAAPVAAPPPVMAPPPIEETVEAPLAPGSDVLESKMHNSTDGTDGSKDTRNQGHEDGSKDARNRLPYGVADVKYLIDMVEFVLEAHKAKNDYNAPAQAGAAAAAADLQEAKTRIFWQKMAENKVDPEYGLPARLKHGTFALSEFQHAALELYLSLNAHPQGFLARACGSLLLLAPFSRPSSLSRLPAVSCSLLLSCVPI